MPGQGGFRFTTGSFETTRAGVLAAARMADRLGYGTFAMADHLYENLAPLPALMMVAEQVSSLRLGTYVLCNDFRHPVVMAKDAATLDVLSGGRLELGLGAGYQPPEYRMAGIAFEPGRVRLQRLAEAVQIVKLAFAGQAFSFDGACYQVRDYTPYPRPVQVPRPPLMLGGGGPGLLSLAAAEADIVSILPAAAPGGFLRATQLTLRSLQDKVRMLREAAGDRWDELEINILIFDVMVTSDRRGAAAAYLAGIDKRLRQFTVDGQLTVEDLLDSPYLMFGTHQQIAGQLRRIRDETGMSYLAIMPHCMETFAPVISQLT
jgi:probable F420-dependent oxidoreductase